MKNGQRFVIGIGIIFWVICSNVQAAVYMSLNATEPNTNVLASCDTGTVSGATWRNDTSGLRDVGQSFFLSTDSLIDAISFQLQGNVQAGVPGAEVAVSIYQSSSASSIGSLYTSYGTGGTETGTVPAWTTGSGAGSWVTFDLTNVTLTAGYYYTVVLSFEANAANRNLVLNVVSAAPYSNGNPWWSTDGTTFSAQTFDYIFVLQGTTLIPEPTTISLVILGTLFVLGLQVRKFRHIFKLS